MLKAIHSRMLAIAVVAAFLVITPSGSSAAQTAEASPVAVSAPRFNIRAAGDQERGWFELELNAGETTQLTAKLSNAGDVDVSILSFVTNAGSAVNGGFSPGALGEALSGPALWLDYPQSTYQLQPGVSQDIEFTVHVPDGTPPGEYVAAIVAQTAEPVEIPGSDVFRQLIRSAISIEITVPGSPSAGFELGAPLVTPSDNQWTIDVPLTNSGTIRVKPQGDLIITTDAGVELSRTQIEMDSVYGGTSTSVRVTLPGQTPPGNYLLTLNLADESTGAADSIATVPITIAKPEAPAVFTIDNVSITPNADPIQYADVAATITNNGLAIPTANVTINVKRDGKDVESYPLATNQALPQGSTNFTQRYIPIDGWQPGTYTFQLVISAVSGGTETNLATIDIENQIIVP